VDLLLKWYTLSQKGLYDGTWGVWEMVESTSRTLNLLTINLPVPLPVLTFWLGTVCAELGYVWIEWYMVYVDIIKRWQGRWDFANNRVPLRPWPKHFWLTHIPRYSMAREWQGKWLMVRSVRKVDFSVWWLLFILDNSELAFVTVYCFHVTSIMCSCRKPEASLVVSNSPLLLCHMKAFTSR